MSSNPENEGDQPWNEAEEEMGPMDGEESEEEDEYYENPVDLIQEFGTHPLMAKAQEALTAQLKETQYKLQVASQFSHTS